MEAIEHPPIFRLPGVPDHVLYTWVVMVILIGLSWAATRRMSLVPRGAQNAPRTGLRVCETRPTHARLDSQIQPTVLTTKIPTRANA